MSWLKVVEDNIQVSRVGTMQCLLKQKDINLQSQGQTKEILQTIQAFKKHIWITMNDTKERSHVLNHTKGTYKSYTGE